MSIPEIPSEWRYTTDDKDEIEIHVASFGWLKISKYEYNLKHRKLHPYKYVGKISGIHFIDQDEETWQCALQYIDTNREKKYVQADRGGHLILKLTNEQLGQFRKITKIKPMPMPMPSSSNQNGASKQLRMW